MKLRIHMSMHLCTNRRIYLYIYIYINKYIYVFMNTYMCIHIVPLTSGKAVSFTDPGSVPTTKELAIAAGRNMLQILGCTYLCTYTCI
jgi:hypothetical protein